MPHNSSVKINQKYRWGVQRKAALLKREAAQSAFQKGPVNKLD